MRPSELISATRSAYRAVMGTYAWETPGVFREQAAETEITDTLKIVEFSTLVHIEVSISTTFHPGAVPPSETFY